MNVITVRKDLHQAIDTIKDAIFLNAIYTIVSSKVQEEDYTKPGLPMDIKTFQKRILQASKNAKEGKIVSHEEIEQETKNW